MKKILLLFVFAAAMTNVFGTTYYWVGGAGTSGSPKDWNTGSNWSTTSGGTPGTVVPGSGDVAYFDATSGNASPFVSIAGYTISLTGLQILPISSATANNVVSFIGTASSFSISGDLTINAVKPSATQYNGQISDYGNNTISVAGNINCNASSSCTLVTAPNTNANSAPGRIALTAATPTIASTATGGNLGFLNFDISSSTYATFGASANGFTITGNLNIQTGGKLTITKTLQFTSTAPTGINPFVFPGTISGGGTVVGNTTWSLNVGGTLPATYTTSNLQSIGTVNLDPTSATTSSIIGMTLGRTYSTVTLGTSNNNTVAVGGSITLNSGVLNDGGNTITVAGGTTIATSNTTAGVAVHVSTGSGKIKAIRTSASPVLVTAAKTISVGNLEIGSASGAVAYSLAASTNLTVNGTLTLNKTGASIANSGTISVASTGGVQMIAGSITGTSPTYASGSTLTYNTGGAVSSTTVEFPNSFPANIAVQSGTLTLDAGKTVTGTTTISSGATLAAPVTFTANGNVSCPGTFQLNQGGYATGSGVWDYSTTGTLAFNNSSGSYGVNTETFWPTTNGPVNVSVLGAGGITMNVARTVSGIVQTAATITNANNLTINGTLQLNNGGSVSAAPVYGSSSTLKYNSGTTYGRYKELDTTTPANIQLSNNTTLNYPNGVSVARTLTGNLTIDAGSSFYMDYGSIGMNQRLTVNGNVTVNGNLSLGDGVGGDLSVGGNWSRAASGSTFNANSREIRFNGTGSQSISRTGGETFSYLTVDKSSNTLTSNAALTINNDLNLNAGTLADGGNTITVIGNVLGSGIHTGAGKISMTGSAKTISGATIENLTLNNAGGFSLNGSPTINGTLTLTAGSFAVGANTLTLNGPTIAGTAKNLSTTSASSLVFGGTSAALSLPSSATALNNLTLNNANATLTVGANHSLAGDLSLTAGTLADNAKTITLSGNIIGTGTHSGTGKISMTGSGKTISAVTGLGNLDINTTGTISASAALPINGNLSFSAAGTLADGGYTITVGGNISGTIGTHSSTGLGKLKMVGDGKSFTANTYGNFEIAGGTSISPISSSGGANFSSGSSFTVETGYYFNAGLNTMQFGATGGTVNIYGTASTTRGNGFYGSFNSVFGWNNTTYPSGITGLSINFNNGSTAVYNSTTSQTVSALTYHHLTVTGARTSGVLTFSNTIRVNGDFTFDATQGGTATITSPVSTTFTFGGSGTQNVSFSGLGANSGTSSINFFNLAINSGANVVSNVDIPVAGALSGTGTFSSASNKITMTGSGKNISGMTISNLEINSGGTITTTAAPTISGTLTLTAGILSNTTNGLTLGNGTTIARTNGTLTAAPTFGTTANLTYNGSSSVSSGNELPTSSSVLNTLTVNNTAGVLIGANTTAENLAINGSGILNVSAGKQLTISTTMTNDGTLNLLSTSNGTATILTPETIEGIGTTNVQQRLTIATGGRNWYISSPVTAATSAVVKDIAGSKLWKYTEANTGTILWDEITVNNQNLEVGRGYVAKLASDDVITFNGTLNNGPVSSPTLTSSGTVSKGFNLVGNPYPSYVNWTDAVKTNVSTSIWYRSKSTGSYLFQTFNVVGDGVGANGGTDIIPPMQSFWVKVPSGTGTVGFTNAMRSHQDQSVATNRLKAPVVSSQKLLRLQVSNVVNADEAVVYFNANAQDGYDSYDSPKMSNANIAIPEIYTTVGGEQLVINGMNSIAANKEIPLGFNTGAANTFTIKATEVRNFDADTKVILKDNVLNTESDITDGTAYTFSSDVTNTSSRFTVVFRSPSLTTDGLENNPIDKMGLNIFRNANNQITINCNGGIGNEGMVTVCNAIGQKLISTATTGTSTVSSPEIGLQKSKQKTGLWELKKSGTLP